VKAFAQLVGRHVLVLAALTGDHGARGRNPGDPRETQQLPPHPHRLRRLLL
jgi:hypothetical protein